MRSIPHIQSRGTFFSASCQNQRHDGPEKQCNENVRGRLAEVRSHVTNRSIHQVWIALMEGRSAFPLIAPAYTANPRSAWEVAEGDGETACGAGNNRSQCTMHLLTESQRG